MSEFGQDRFAAGLYGGKPGFFVDVGAHDGITISNTLALEGAGWGGICIEPHPNLFKRLKETRRAECINVACAEAGGMMPFNLRDVEGWSGLSRTQPREFNERTIEVEVVPLRRILAWRGNPRVHYLSIDTEGGDLNVLRGIDFSECWIGCISVEVDKVSAEEVRFLLTNAGYEPVASLGVDDIYVRKGGVE